MDMFQAPTLLEDPFNNMSVLHAAEREAESAQAKHGEYTVCTREFSLTVDVESVMRKRFDWCVNDDYCSKKLQFTATLTTEAGLSCSNIQACVHGENLPFTQNR